ncbi:hypothetical protein, conserved [Leishmania donovani]|uniref:Vacuolar protein-sorting-associated protein 36 n=1 Tax=Leishmania donovani TaxID=5661 RepID=A0A3S7WVL4_LEIDO|nr:hypothetical protein, conserved [Leishmania donovani]AYU78172.1 Vacuolar protein sorting protein 36 Vps36/EAP30/Vps36 family, putative [Leishmania donovani]TPP50993.1 EAP30/Vps36 family protein [Leishmania donovani]CBZ33545.1 hypothetical protein, conserved [Leishmania donovani]
MDYWEWKTDGAGLEVDEVCITVQHGVTLYNKNEKTQRQNGKLSLTTHHLRYNDEADISTVLQLPLELVRRSGQAPSISSGFSPFSSAKIIVPLPQNAYVKLSFRSGGVDNFYAALVGALEKKAWLQTKTKAAASGGGSSSGASPASATPVPSPSPSPPVPRGFGIAGVQQASAQSAAMSETLKDIDDVMNKASKLVNDIRRLRERSEAAAAAGSDAGSETAVERTTIESIESTLGLGAIVTRNHSNGSDSRFHRDLAVEMHTWMTHENNSKLFNDMPVVPLIELFALYNKARGGDLVSPLDVLHACTYMAAKMSGSCYDLVTLSSGRKALVNRDDSLLLAKLTTVLGPQLVNAKGSSVQDAWKKTSSHRQQQRSGDTSSLVRVPTTSDFPKASRDLKSVSDVSLAEKMQVATEVAADILTLLMQKGYLCCVDTGFDCYVYTWNIFVF